MKRLLLIFFVLHVSYSRAQEFSAANIVDTCNRVLPVPYALENYYNVTTDSCIVLNHDYKHCFPVAMQFEIPEVYVDPAEVEDYEAALKDSEENPEQYRLRNSYDIVGKWELSDETVVLLVGADVFNPNTLGGLDYNYYLVTYVAKKPVDCLLVSNHWDGGWLNFELTSESNLTLIEHSDIELKPNSQKGHSEKKGFENVSLSVFPMREQTVNYVITNDGHFLPRRHSIRYAYFANDTEKYQGYVVFRFLRDIDEEEVAKPNHIH